MYRKDPIISLQSSQKILYIYILYSSSSLDLDISLT